MSLGHGAKIVTNGLVFAYDMGPNPGVNKSWKGKPATNLYADGDYSTQTLHPVRNGPWSFPAGITDPYGNQVLRIDQDGTTSYHGRDIAVTVGETYTSSAWIYASPDSNTTALRLAGEQGFAPDAAYDLSKKGTWQRVSITGTATTTNARILAYQLSNMTTGYCLFGSIQFEQGSFATPFVNGTRSNTEALLDWAGNNTITKNNITYNSDGSFEFNGSSDYISNSQNIIKTTGGWTIENWFKLDVVNSASLYNFIGDAAITYNSWYWTVYNSKLALWNRSPGLWNYGSTTIQPNTWYSASIVCSDSGTQYQFYLNGIAEGGTHSTYTWNSAYAGLQMGYIGRGNSANGRYFNGQLPSTKVYDRALTAAEVAQNFNALRGRYGI